MKKEDKIVGIFALVIAVIIFLLLPFLSGDISGFSAIPIILLGYLLLIVLGIYGLARILAYLFGSKVQSLMINDYIEKNGIPNPLEDVMDPKEKSKSK